MKMQKEDLLFALELVLKDEFVANVETQQDTIFLRFLNGETFCLNVKKA
jgi:hypothetical protein